MTPAEETEFIALWNQGLEIAVMAERLGIPRGMVQSRAHRLQRRGLIQPQPKGGAYPRQKVLARQDGSPATPAMTFVAVPEIQELLSLVKDLHARVGALEQTRVPTALPAPPATPVTPAPPAPPAAERKDIQQGTVRLSKALIEHLKAVGYERRIPPKPTRRGAPMESPDRPVAINVVTAHDIEKMLRPAFHEFFERRQYLPVEE